MTRIIALFLALFASAAIAAGGDVKQPYDMRWSFDGPMGKFDKPAIQRGLQVYREVCSACHGIKRIAFRNLTNIGFSDAEVKALAAEYTMMDGPNDEGEMFERPGKPSDYFPDPYANEQAARYINNGAFPPDLSLITKSRPNGANYVYSLITGYEDAPADSHLMAGQHYNPYFAGGAIGMAPPIASDGQVEYQDGTDPTVNQMTMDIVNFLQWTAEPEMQDRKAMGLKVMIFLFIMTVFFYIAMKRVWADIKKK